jgi:tetratricopeptide (TPR) repeat protein
MSDTNSFNNPNSWTSQSLSSDTEASKTTDILGHVFFERIGVGGMGEVYRCTDAFQRDLAIKVLRPELDGDATAEERFLREARLTGSLQHPGIVPVHNLGRLADGRPSYTMKLVRGRTLAELLRDEPPGPERLPRLLAVVEKVCQAVAFAHSKGVIHRDLKPNNVMVGEFGEVQVMDWGLGKQLSCSEPSPPPSEPTEDVDTVGQVEEAEGLSRAGAALGTPAYMPPEQAVGDWDIVDERADVFALGAILCEVLTGRPPYYGANRDDLLRRARRGDMAEVWGRLEKCGADSKLVELCRECLAGERLQRPRHAGAVSERLASYQAEVRERLRQAELERARAEVKALEERKRRRLIAVVGWAGLVLLAGGLVAGWQWQQRRIAADGAVVVALVETRSSREQARSDVLTAAGYDKALAAAQHAVDIARAGGASESMSRQAEELLGELEQEKEAAAKDRRLLAQLLEVRGPREGPKYSRDDKGTMMALAEPTAEELFAMAFREWGLDVDAVPVAEAVERLKARPAAVVTEVIAALDEWTNQRRLDKKPESARRIAELAAALDAEPGSMRSELREIMAKGRLPVEQALGVLAAALRPVQVPAVVPLGRDCTRLRQLAERIDPAVEPVLGLLTLTRALRVAGEEAMAERLLRAALTARPREVVLYHTLGDLLKEQEPPRWAEAVECYAVARGLRPDLGVILAVALPRSNREREGLNLLARLVKERPDNPYLLFVQGNLQREMGDLDGSTTCYKKALELDPKDARVHTSLGAALHHKHDLDGAIACYKKALELDAKLALAHSNLGAALSSKGDLDGAIACYKKALELDAKLFGAHTGLGVALQDKHDLDGALACFRKALALDPKYATTQLNLGNALREKGDMDGAIAHFKKALELDPKYAKAHYNLGHALYHKRDLDGAIACFKKAIELEPKGASAHTNLGIALREKGDLDGALACFHKALALNPKLATAQLNLGNALREKGDLGGAITCYQKALALDPKYAKAHTNLGAALANKGDLDGAIARFKKAIELDPKDAMACGALGMTLRRQGRYAEALDVTRRALTLLPSGHLQQRFFAQQLRSCEQCLALDGKLTAILQGATTPASPGEAVTLAQMCQQPKRQHVAAARLYADAFAAEPKLAADLNQQHRYSAARSAALAAAGQGEGARLLPDKVAGMFRRWALDWLRDDLTAYTKLSGQNNAAMKQVIQQRLVHWKSDSDLVTVRELDRLPESERTAWQVLWRDVDELLTQVAKKNEPTKGH